LRTSGLARSKLGVVLASAAMMDDVIGLVMVQVIANLGSASAGSFGWKTAVRPLGVSLAFAIGVPAACWMARPVIRMRWECWLGRLMRKEHVPVITQTLFLLGMVTAAIYAGTSSLFAAYLAGAVVSWWDGVRHPEKERKQKAEETGTTNGDPVIVQDALAGITTQTERVSATDVAKAPTFPTHGQATSGVEVFEKYFTAALHRVLKPFFFVRTSVWIRLIVICYSSSVLILS
jgi:hypothetical protein